MAAPKPLTDFQRSANVARYVQILDIALNEVHARLLAPRGSVLEEPSLTVKVQKSAKVRFDEDSKCFTATISLLGQVLPKSDQDSKDPVIEISCEFSLAYRFDVKGGPEGEEREKYLQSFADINGMYNAWPYFRELFQSSISRMGLPPMVLPLYRPEKETQ